MGATTYDRQGDFTDDETSNKSGRVSQDSAQLDAELDAIRTAINDHAVDLDLILRDDDTIKDDFVAPHGISSETLSWLLSQLTAGSLVWRNTWTGPGTAYALHDLVIDSGNVYIANVAHTSAATFAADAANWDLFLSGALPSQATHANKALVTNGTAASWQLITTANAPTLAPLASPVLTGQVTLPSVKGSVTAVASAANIALNFDNNLIQEIAALATNVTFTTSNRAAGKAIDIKITSDGGGPYTLAWPVGWMWITSIPSSIAASKTAILNLRCFGAADTDIVASYSVEA